MGVGDWFEEFNNNLRIPKDVIDSISYRYKRLTKQINLDFWGMDSDTAHSFYIGSYGRGTILTTSDIDVMIQLQYDTYVQYNNHNGNGQSALLQSLKNTVSKTYNSYIKADGQVVAIDFTDGINFEIVPAFINKDKSFTYPDTNDGGSWKSVDPKSEIIEMNRENIVSNKNLKRLCRMARAWKERWDVPISGLLLDTLAFNYLKSYKNKGNGFVYYDWMSRDFFEFLKNQPEQTYWYAMGSNQKVYSKGYFQYKALRCYNIAMEAIGKEKFDYASKTKWREIYGTRFPR